MNDLQTSITKAFDYLSTNSIEIPADLLIQTRGKGVLATKAVGDLAGTKAGYHDAITGTLVAYFEGGNTSASKNNFKQATTSAFGDAFELGYSDGGGELPFTGKALEWFNSRLTEEFAHIDSLYIQAKELKKEAGFDFFTWATERADSYTGALDGVYNAGIMFAKKNQMLTWHLGNTEKHCKSCLKLDGGRHRASWYVDRDYIPRKPGAAMDCGGYHCDCRLTDDNGNEVTI